MGDAKKTYENSKKDWMAEKKKKEMREAACRKAEQTRAEALKEYKKARGKEKKEAWKVNRRAYNARKTKCKFSKWELQKIIQKKKREMMKAWKKLKDVKAKKERKEKEEAEKKEKQEARRRK